jgi:RNA polymerase sigma-70 factor (ECF subfamily)
MAPAREFAEVYADCHRHVHALCLNLLGTTADAEDAFQDTFIAVAQALPSFRGDANVKTWVHRIAIRVALKLRARRRPTDELADDLPGAVRDPIADHADADAMARALGALSFEHRLVLSLFAVAGLTHAEIAETLGVPEGTVWSRLHHAKKRLGELLPEPRR